MWQSSQENTRVEVSFLKNVQISALELCQKSNKKGTSALEFSRGFY